MCLGAFWRAASTQPGFGALVLVGKGNVLDKGLRSKASVGTFLCQCCAEEAIHGLDALI